jgi:hypothetical protein
VHTFFSHCFSRQLGPYTSLEAGSADGWVAFQDGSTALTFRRRPPSSLQVRRQSSSSPSEAGMTAYVAADNDDDDDTDNTTMAGGAVAVSVSMLGLNMWRRRSCVLAASLDGGATWTEVLTLTRGSDEVVPTQATKTLPGVVAAEHGVQLRLTNHATNSSFASCLLVSVAVEAVDCHSLAGR